MSSITLVVHILLNPFWVDMSLDHWYKPIQHQLLLVIMAEVKEVSIPCSDV